MEPIELTLGSPERLGLGLVDYFKKEEEKLIERFSELEAQLKWTKFDSSKGDTYPPKGMFLAWGWPSPDYRYQGCSPTWFICWRNDYGFSCDESAYPEVHYWRHLPDPPQEETK